MRMVSGGVPSAAVFGNAAGCAGAVCVAGAFDSTSGARLLWHPARHTTVTRIAK